MRPTFEALEGAINAFSYAAHDAQFRGDKEREGFFRTMMIELQAERLTLAMNVIQNLGIFERIAAASRID